jgi:hypothetical protein
MPATLRDRLQEFRRVLAEFDACVEDLHHRGWFSDRQFDAMNRMIDDEVARANKCLAGAIATPDLPKMPAPAGKANGAAAGGK